MAVSPINTHRLTMYNTKHTNNTKVYFQKTNMFKHQYSQTKQMHACKSTFSDYFHGPFQNLPGLIPPP